MREGDLDSIWKFAGLVVKVKHNQLWSTFPLTLALLKWFELEIVVFAEYAAQFHAVCAEGKVIDVNRRQKSLMESFRNVNRNGADLDPKTGYVKKL